MNFFIVRKNHNYILSLLLIIFFLLGMSACKRRDTEDQFKKKQAENIKRFYDKLPRPINKGVQSRITRAISAWNNDQVDKVPILFYAKVVKQSNSGEYYLILPFSDEDANILGIGIREVRNSNGRKNVVEERYPIYIQNSPHAVFMALIPIQERTANQTKDETAWSLYMRGEGEFSISKEKMPPLWISLPDDPNRIPEVFLYDKDGHVSEFIPIVVGK